MKVLLIDDHPMVVSALQTVLQRLDDDISVFVADSAQAARESLAAVPDYKLVLLDMQLGDADGHELIQELRTEHPALPVVVISASERPHDILRAIDLGAMGVVSKRVAKPELFEALQRVLAGEVYLPPMPLPSVYSAPSVRELALREASHGIQTSVFHTCAHGNKPTLGLTPRQTDVLQLLLKGQPNKLIARELDLSVETVKDHVAAVLRTLGVSSRTQAVIAVNQLLNRASPKLSVWPSI